MEQEISGLKVCRQLLLLQTLIQIRPQVVIFTGLLQRCKQWGINTGGAVRTSTLPIPFTNVFLAVASTSSEWCCPGCSATNTTVTTRAYQSNRPDVAQPNDVNWIIIGCQPQWGNLWAGYTEVLNWYFPLTTSQVYAVCLTKHTKNISSGHNWEPARIEEWNNSYARIHPDGDLGYSVIAICKAQQQWGNSASLSGYVAVCIFPISFTTTDYTAVATGVMSAADATFGKENYVNNILWDFTSESQVAFRLSHLDRPTLRYIAIGF